MRPEQHYHRSTTAQLYCVLVWLSKWEIHLFVLLPRAGRAAHLCVSSTGMSQSRVKVKKEQNVCCTLLQNKTIIFFINLCHNYPAYVEKNRHCGSIQCFPTFLAWINVYLWPHHTVCQQVQPERAFNFTAWFEQMFKNLKLFRNTLN